MSIFITADLHLGHNGIREHCNRPWPTIEEHDEGIISNWNADVKRKDMVYIVGDFAWKHHNKYLARLNGKKILIRGNHDRMNQECLRNFTEVHDLLTKKIDGKIVILCHYCLRVWDRSFYGTWHCYGHSHGRILETGNILRCDVGADVWDYRPVPWEAVKKKLEARKREYGGRRGDFIELDKNVERNRLDNLALLKGLYGQASDPSAKHQG